MKQIVVHALEKKKSFFPSGQISEFWKLEKSTWNKSKKKKTAFFFSRYTVKISFYPSRDEKKKNKINSSSYTMTWHHPVYTNVFMRHRRRATRKVFIRDAPPCSPVAELSPEKNNNNTCVAQVYLLSYYYYYYHFALLR